MRKLKTFPALAAVRMPRLARVLGVHPMVVPDQAPALLVEYDPEQEPVERSFTVLRSGDQVPSGAAFVDSWRDVSDGRIAALFELVDSDLPDDLPDDQARADYRLLLAEGYTAAERPGLPRHSWKAPDDVPAGQHSFDATVAIARLQEHGYGPVVE